MSTDLKTIAYVRTGPLGVHAMWTAEQVENTDPQIVADAELQALVLREDAERAIASAAPAGGAEPVAEPMDDDELQDFCISLSFEQDDYTTEVIRAVEDRMRGVPLFLPAPTAQPQPTHHVSFPRPGSAPLVVADDAQLQWDEGEGPAQPERLPHVSALDPAMQAINASAARMEDGIEKLRTDDVSDLDPELLALAEQVTGAQPKPDDLITVAHIECEGGAGTLTVDFDQMGTLGVLLGEEEETYTVRIAPMTRSDFEALGEFDGF